MKTRITRTLAAAASALALVTAPAMAAQSGNNHGPTVSKMAKTNGHKFSKGQKFERSKATNYRVVDYKENKRLSAPPKGYHWVRNGDDALRVGITSGIVASVVSNLF